MLNNKKHGFVALKNNLIILAIHAFLVAIFLIWAFYTESLYSTFDSLLNLAFFILSSLCYILCGFFLLKPVKKYLFLSVIPVTIAIIIISLYITKVQFNFSGKELNTITAFILHPHSFSLLFSFALLERPRPGVDVPSDPIIRVIFIILLLISLLSPSLLPYLGMRLKKRLLIKKEKKNTIQQGTGENTAE